MHQIINGKYDELYEDFANNGINLIFNGHLILEESTGILSENASQKAKKAAKDKHILSIGDDSGVFIEALDFFPGVNSRRWFADEKDDHARNQKIISMMSEESNRHAYLISRFSVADEGGNIIAKESVKNEFDVAYCETGSYGFGYDNILIPSKALLDSFVQSSDAFSKDDFEYIERENIAKEIEEKRMSVAELPQELKNKINNRGGKIAGSIASQIKEYYKKKGK